jgi:hypothetical protein
MRRIFLAAALLIVLGNVGCLPGRNSSDPNERMQQLLNDSENLRQSRTDVNHAFMTDQPSHLTGDRLNGAIR